MLEKMRNQLLSELTGDGAETLKNTPVTFSMKVESMSQEEGCTLLESLMYLQEEFQLDPDQIPKLITPGLKQKLAYETGIEKPGVALEM